MIDRSGKDIRTHGDSPSFPGYGVAGWVTGTFVLSVLLAIAPLPRAFSQPGSSADSRFKQSFPSTRMPGFHRSSTPDTQHTSKDGQPKLLPYDVRPKSPASQLPRGFHNAKDLLPHSASIEPSNIHQLRAFQPSGTCPSKITQSTSQAIVAGSLACSDPGLGTLENHYWRAFNMDTFTGGQAYDITSVEFGIEQAESLFGADQPLTVNLYINHG